MRKEARAEAMWDQRAWAGAVLREGGSGYWCWVRVYLGHGDWDCDVDVDWGLVSYLGFEGGVEVGVGAGESPWRVTRQMRRFVPPRSRAR